ncbi:hypothetical protein PDESU_00498 [Pontiella desulfatans]|uniref:Cell division protein FtsL n=1 Tax=Pontiella desulfatans TaxID=2750659 RepID=A0A6C2TWB0_PONDE|nr:hypothetical protein [Pontiella desulfatans]VGO11950.1 hypothetical protein PDESU_00498 [Pontiella desulfatans]
MATKRKTVRKKKPTKKNQVQVPFPVVLANVLVMVAVLGLSYMWLCSRCDALGKEIKNKERELRSANKRLTHEQDRWSSITSPVNLERAIKKYRLNMTMPKGNQVVKISNWDGQAGTAKVEHR